LPGKPDNTLTDRFAAWRVSLDTWIGKVSLWTPQGVNRCFIGRQRQVRDRDERQRKGIPQPGAIARTIAVGQHGEALCRHQRLHRAQLLTVVEFPRPPYRVQPAWGTHTKHG